MDTKELVCEKEGLKLYTDYDHDAESPRTWDNLGIMICFHSRYNLGDYEKKKKNYCFRSVESFQEYLKEEGENIAVILPLYLYDHSGITMRTSSFSDVWDSGQVGYIFVTKEQIRNEFKVKKVTKKLLQDVEKQLKGEVETYDTFLRGDVYEYLIEDSEGEIVDSCCGFYGLDYTKQEGMNRLNYEIERRKKENKKIDLCMVI